MYHTHKVSYRRASQEYVQAEDRKHVLWTRKQLCIA